MVLGYNVRPIDHILIENSYEDYASYRFDKYISSEALNLEKYFYKDYFDDDSRSNELNEEKSSKTVANGPMDSPWPMYCHDVRHTGRSPYSTADIWGDEKWRFETDHHVRGSPVIDNEGTIYVGSTELFAVYQNGTLKWSYDYPDYIESAPAIDENGIIYFGTIWAMPDHLYAIYINNGTLKWKFEVGYWIYSSPAIGDDGTIYFGCADKFIYALYPNGSLRWKYETDAMVLSSPAIGADGTIYCGSHDHYLYALYPNNGTLKWRFPTDHWIRTSPCIADDGTIYCVSLDEYLYAINPDGTFKWKTDVGAGTSPTIGQDGTIYCGYNKLYAINPVNGSVKWSYDNSGNIRGGTPCNSIDGTIYFGTDSGWIYAINPDGTEKWSKHIGSRIESAPAIGEDGIVYTGVFYETYGYVYAFGPGEANKIEIESPEQGKLYLFNHKLVPTPFGKTRIVGDIRITIKAYSEDEVESIDFYIDGSLMHTDTESPFYWDLDQRLGDRCFGWHTLKVTAIYEGGCSWTEEMDFWYFHL